MSFLLGASGGVTSEQLRPEGDLDRLDGAFLATTCTVGFASAPETLTLLCQTPVRRRLLLNRAKLTLFLFYLDL